MKRTIALILAIVMAFSLCACGAKDKKENGPAPAENKVEEASESAQNPSEADASNSEAKGESDSSDSKTDEEKQLEEDMEALSKIGDVEVENGILTVSITLPAEFCEGVTQEQLDAGKGGSYQSAVLNDDGSVTYKMTKQQHQEMLKSMTESFDESLQELIDDDNYTITDIKHNEDFTVFDVTLEGTEIGFADSFTSIVFYMCGGMYGIFNGTKADHVVVNYLDPDGNLIDSIDSDDM